MPELEIHEAGDWAALYSNGNLVATGHTVHEEALQMLGVKTIQDDAFLRGGTGSGRKGTPSVATTLDEVREYAAERNFRREQARQLREQAATLITEADALMRGHR